MAFWVSISLGDLNDQEESHEVKEYLFFKQSWREACCHT
jgi:hypothetical protein